MLRQVLSSLSWLFVRLLATLEVICGGILSASEVIISSKFLKGSHNVQNLLQALIQHQYVAHTHTVCMPYSSITVLATAKTHPVVRYARKQCHLTIRNVLITLLEAFLSPFASLSQPVLEKASTIWWQYDLNYEEAFHNPETFLWIENRTLEEYSSQKSFCIEKCSKTRLWIYWPERVKYWKWWTHGIVIHVRLNLGWK